MREQLRRLLVRLLEYIDGVQISAQRKWDAKRNGEIFDQQDRAIATYQSRCNHRKGGVVRPSNDGRVIAAGLQKGGSAQYAVRKHQMMNGDWWIDCMRCGKKWRPPIRSEFSSERAFYRAVEEYERARDFETNNTSSSSIQMAFRDKRTGASAEEQITKMYAKIGG